MHAVSLGHDFSNLCVRVKAGAVEANAARLASPLSMRCQLTGENVSSEHCER